jgi:threonine synthase
VADITGYRCIRCNTHFSEHIRFDARGCIVCEPTAPANLRPVYHANDGDLSGEVGEDRPASMWRYGPRLPGFNQEIISLGEGQTPLTRATKLGEVLDVRNLFIKEESRNPTASHKDRFSTVAVSDAVQRGATTVATASSGNAGASLAAYAAKANLRCVVATFAGAAGPMIAQIEAFGAVIVPMRRKLDRWTFLKQAAAERDWYVTSPYRDPVVGSHPVGIEGYKTIAYEIFDQQGGRVPDWCVLPVCYGDALSGVAEGFAELVSLGQANRVPRMVAAEIHGSLAAALARNTDLVDAQNPRFETAAISIGTTRSTFQALDAIRRSCGEARSASNEQLLEMRRALAISEGIFAELASVAPLVAVKQLRKDQIIQRTDQVVVVLTASGLKDIGLAAADDEQRPAFDSPEAAWEWFDGRDEFPRADDAIGQLSDHPI